MSNQNSNKYDLATTLAWYKTMVRIRDFENILDEYNKLGKLYGTTHLYNGEEAIATGICYGLAQDDLILSTHRNHGHAIAKGTNTYKMFAEIFGKVDGTNGGRGGSMHISDHSVGNMGGNGIVGGNFPVALGLATALKMDNSNNIVVCFSGDGATNEGTFHESMNLASIWKLPIIFVIENNQYAMSSETDKMVAGSISERAKAYEMTNYKVDGQDIYKVLEVFNKSRKSLKNGPVLLEAVTYRFKGHSRSDGEVYRSKDDFLNYEDPIFNLRQNLLENYDITVDQLSLIDEQIYKELLDEAKTAYEAEDACVGENLWEDVYAD